MAGPLEVVAFPYIFIVKGAARASAGQMLWVLLRHWSGPLIAVLGRGFPSLILTLGVLFSPLEKYLGAVQGDKSNR